jgi:hypothetical protein
MLQKESRPIVRLLAFLCYYGSPRGFGLLAGLSLSAHGFHPSHIGLGIGYLFLKLAFLSEVFM